MIELISTVRPKNNQGYPIVLSNDIKGGLHSVSSITERDNISEERLSNGMLCYVDNDGMYQYIDGNWNLFKSGSGGSITVNTYDEMLSLDISDMELGTLCYVKDDQNSKYMYYLSADGWSGFGGGGGYHIGTTPPDNTDLIWIDTTSAKQPSDNFLDLLLEEVKNSLKAQNDKIAEMSTIIISQQTDILELQAQVKALKEIVDGGIIINTNSILTEDGDVLTTEDGYIIIMETDDDRPVTDAIMTELGDYLITEDGDVIVIESDNVTINAIMTEKNEFLLTENNINLIIE